MRIQLLETAAHQPCVPRGGRTLLQSRKRVNSFMDTVFGQLLLLSEDVRMLKDEDNHVE